MPEQLSKHPEVTLEVLRSSGAACGTGAPQEILKACPAGRFCKLPGGELCVYGLPEAKQMTQITEAEWRAVLQPPAAPPVPPEAPAAVLLPGALAILAGLALGFVAGWLASRRGRRRS
jgi:hypothetical protein